MKSQVDINYIIVFSVTILLVAGAGVYASMQPTEDPATPEEKAQACYNDSFNDSINKSANKSVNDSIDYSQHYDEELKACLDPNQRQHNRS